MTTVKVALRSLTGKQALRAILAAVLRLERQVSALDDKVAELTTAVGEVAGRLQAKVDALEAKIAEGDTDVAENIAAIQVDIDALGQIGVDQPPA